VDKLVITNIWEEHSVSFFIVAVNCDILYFRSYISFRRKEMPPFSWFIEAVGSCHNLSSHPQKFFLFNFQWLLNLAIANVSILDTCASQQWVAFLLQCCEVGLDFVQNYVALIIIVSDHCRCTEHTRTSSASDFCDVSGTDVGKTGRRLVRVYFSALHISLLLEEYWYIEIKASSSLIFIPFCMSQRYYEETESGCCRILYIVTSRFIDSII
jgi:hypothetical protein